MHWKALSAVILAASICFLSLTNSDLSGQAATARVDGVVKDQIEAVVPGVVVTLTDQGTNLTREVITNDRGRYLFVSVRPAFYTLGAELPGFKRYTRPHIKVEVGDTLTLDVLLEIGAIEQQTTVTAAAPTVDRVSQSLGGVVNEQKISDLPLVDRDPMFLFFLQAGTNRFFPERFSRGGQVDGLREGDNNVQIEGISANQPVVPTGATFSAAPVINEAIAEYRVVTSSASAEHGLGSGAQVQMIYKSGTNDLHGSVFYFHRNGALNANEFFRNRGGIERPFFLRHQYGFAVGGPVIKNKAFFHFTYEKIDETQDATILNEVYTDRFKETGIFQYPNTDTGEIQEIDLTTIDPTRIGISPLWSSFASMLPSPNNMDTGDGLNTAGHRFSSDDPWREWRFVVKGDYIFNDRHRLAVSGANRKIDDSSARHILGPRLAVGHVSLPAVIVSLTSTLTPSLLNELRLGGTSDKPRFTNGDETRFTNFPLLNFSGLGWLFSPFNPNRSPRLPFSSSAATLTINDNLTWIRGDHTFKGGVDIRINRWNNSSGGDFYLPVADTLNSFNPASIPSIPGLDGNDGARAPQLTNDVTGSLGFYFQTFQQITPEGDAFIPLETKLRRWRSREYSFFFQDTWKVHDRLTLQLGTRYEVLPSVYEDQGIFSYPVSGGQPCVQCVFGISGPGETTIGLLPEAGRELYNTDWNNFAPNLGFTFDPTGAGKSSIAANYRISYDRNQMLNTEAQDRDNPGATTFAFLFGSPGDRLDRAFELVDTVDPGVPFGPKAFDRTGEVTVWDDRYTTPYVQSWSLRIQREIMRNTLLEAAYVGNHGVGLPRAINFNQIIVRENGFLDGFLAAQRNLVASEDPVVGEDTGVFGQIWNVMIPPHRNQLLPAISRGTVASVADFIDLRGYPEAVGLPLNFFRANPQFQDAWLLGRNSHSTYHGLKLEVRRRFSEGLQFQANYTFSKNLTDFSGSGNEREHFRDNADFGLDKTNSFLASRYILNANAIYELPFGRGRRWGSFSNRFLEGALGGWQINGIVNYSSGRKNTISSNGRQTLTTGDFGTVTFSGTDPGITSKAIRGDDIVFLTEEEKGLFEHPVAGSAGLTARRFFSSPASWALDASFFKEFTTPWLGGENSRLQFRVEAFNLTNSTRFTGYDLNFASSTFGRIFASLPPRIVQVGLKFLF